MNRYHYPLTAAVRPLVLFCTVLVFLACSGCSQHTPTLPPLSRGAVIVAFGDSLTYGTGVSAEQSYPAQLQRIIGHTVVNEGVPGEVTAAGLRRLPEVLDADHPALLILCHGGNDLLRRLDRKQTVANLRAMVQLARARHIEVVLIGVPRPALLGLKDADFYRQVADQFGIPLEDKVLPRIEADRALKSDRVHPNAAGYRLLAEAVAKLLRNSGAI